MSHHIPQLGEAWMHYKGEMYTIEGIGHDSISGDMVVVYTDKLGAIWTRPVSNFLGWTEDHKRRFTLYKRI